jgi:hypothetical protein
MRHSTPIRAAAALALLVLHLAGARAGAEPGPGSGAAPCGPADAPAPDQPAVVRDRIGFNFPAAALDGTPPRALELCAQVDERGFVREVRVRRGGTPFDSAAVDAVRWWLFEPARRAGRPTPSWVTLSVTPEPPTDALPLVPDVLALAQDAEAAGDLRGAIDAWTGVLARVGQHPTLSDEWSVRERVLRLAARLPKPPQIPLATEGRARGARNLMQRNIARGDNADYAGRLDEVLLVAPWYVDAYRWRAAARAASGMRDGAERDALCYRLAAPDSASRALADRALAALAAGDTLAANSLLKN